VSVLAPERLQGLGAAAAPKLAQMRTALSELGSALVAFSGGVDSTFVLQVAVQVLGDTEGLPTRAELNAAGL